MPVLFAVTLFVSASLLFMVQPMVGRMILPLLGGSPAAWNTCMVFFQAMLLLGYLYAHKVTNRLAPRRQVVFHLVVLGGAILALALGAALTANHSPIAVVRSLAPQNTPYPMFGVLGLLFVAVGIPFFAVSTSAPLLQRWFAYSGHPAARDPYFLYAASNAGSLLALLGYPLVTEPSLRLVEQAWVWAAGFAVLAALIAVCGRTVAPPAAPGKKIPGRSQPPAVPADGGEGPPPTLARKLRWLSLAFVPSSLMLGVTTYMTTDIASVPLLWVLPLAMYLLTFIIAYARTPGWFVPVLGNVSPVVTLLLVFLITSQESQSLPPFWMIALHLAAYFLAALLLHTELAHDRPPPAHLTNYFLWISVGGMLGGVFNALVAPVAFPLAYEYPISIAIGCMLIPKLDDYFPQSAGDADEGSGSRKRTFSRVLDVAVPVLMLAAVYGLTELTGWGPFRRACFWIGDNVTAAFQYCHIRFQLSPAKIESLIVWAVPVMACFFFIDRPVRFGLCVAAILLVGYYQQSESYVIKTERSFFGILKVEDYGGFRRLLHGTTLHGTQATEPGILADQYKDWYVDLLEAGTMAGAVRGWSMREEPLTYYTRTGPVGHLFRATRAKDPKAPFAMIGLGTGSVSCYALPGQKLTFYEIDPSVKALVADTDRYFTFVTDARNRGADVEIVMGDARLRLEEQPDRRYQLLLVDAFSSDSIPVHLLTREAVELYMNRVTDDGLVALHISNKYVKLEPVAARIAEDLGLSARVFSDGYSDENNIVPLGKTQSSWVVLARRPEQVAVFDGPEFVTTYPSKYANIEPRVNTWTPLTTDPAVPAWTDDYADVLSVMMIKEVQRARRLFGMPVVRDLAE